MGYILAIDLGSTQMKLMVMNENADSVAVVSEKYPTDVKSTGELEQNPEDWEKALKKGIRRLRQVADLSEVGVVSFSGHMSGVVFVDQQGNVLYPCIMLSDNRSQKQSEELREWIGEEVRQKTGNPINNAFSLPKILWMKEERPDIYKRSAAWLSPKDYIRYCLTGELATEYTDAYNSLCVHRTTLEWDEELIRKSTLNRRIFPKMLKPSEIAGNITEAAEAEYGLRKGIPVVAGGADMACAALGSGLSREGDTALTLGTCATFFSIVPGTDEECYGKVTFHPLISGKKMYALGSHINGGAAVNWASSIFSETAEINYQMIAELSRKASEVSPGSNGLITLPFLNGSGSPYFCALDKAHVCGMKMGTTREELFRSLLEGVTCNLMQSLLVFRKMAEIEKLMLAGGGIHVDVWPTIIKDVFGIPVEISDHPDVSTVGAALIGGSAVGYFPNPEEIALKKRKVIETRLPNQKNHKYYKKLYEKYLVYYKIMHELDLKEQYERESCL